MSRLRRNVLLVATTMLALLSSPLAGITPAEAQGHSGGGGDRVTVGFSITGVRCEVEVTGERTRPDGTTIVRTVQTGFTESSIDLMTGVLTTDTVTVTRPSGRVRAYGRWTLEPATSTGSIRGTFDGKLTAMGALEVTAVGRGTKALSGVAVRMTTSGLAVVSEEPCLSDFAFTGSGRASANPGRDPIGAVVATSTKSFEQTVADLTTVIEANPNLRLIQTIDHQAAAASRDLALPPTKVLVFGNPALGSPLMQSSQTTGIDLPQKMLIWQDQLGTVRVAYNSPGYLASRHGLTDVEPQLETITGALAALAGAATGTTVKPVFNAGQVNEGKGLVKVMSDRSAEDAFAAIVAALQAAPPINVPLTVEHDVNATNAGLDLRPTKLVVFGNPSLGTGLMQTDQSIALDLPQKILVYEDDNGQTIIAYNDPTFVAKRHQVRGQDERLAILAGALANFASLGT